MTYLQRLDGAPSRDKLSPAEAETLDQHFMATGADLVVDGQIARWEHIDAVEVAAAPRVAGLAGWLVKKFLMGDQDRYHVGIYFGSAEVVLPNVTWDIARYVLQTIAYHAPNRVSYTGPEDLVPLTEI
jgi:hypothetical protein